MVLIQMFTQKDYTLLIDKIEIFLSLIFFEKTEIKIKTPNIIYDFTDIQYYCL